MKTNRIAKEFEFIGTNYRVQYYLGAEIISIEEKVQVKWWQKGDYKWQLIYMGHIDPLVESIKFFKELKYENNNKSL